MNRKVRGMVFTIISALLFGVTPILASMTYDMGSNANTLTFYRNLMVVPVLLVIMLIKKTPLRVPWKELLFLLAVSVLFSVSTTYMLYESYNYVGVGTAQTIHFLYPVVTALLCRFCSGSVWAGGNWRPLSRPARECSSSWMAAAV